MINYQLLELLESILGKGRQTSGDNIAFNSPFCNHHKPKLEINLDSELKENPWHCWISDAKGKSVHSLLKKLKVNKDIIQKLEKITGSKFYINTKNDEIKLELPKEFISLSSINKQDVKNPYIKNALFYLKKRNVTPIDIIRYNIGVCISGEYANRIIIPSYDAEGALNYFVSRAINDTPIKYKNPKISKNIIAFDFYINWQLPILLVEGVFDAMAAKYNAIPLLGKFMTSELKQKILTKNVNEIYIALDEDAIRDTIKIAKYCIYNGIAVYYIKLGKKDPSELGHTEFMEKYNKAEILTESKLIEMEISA
jgi:DNA primase